MLKRCDEGEFDRLALLVARSRRRIPVFDAERINAEGLVDEYQLWIHPVVVGGVGKRLFEDGNPLTKLRLVDSRTTPGGLVILTYGRA